MRYMKDNDMHVIMVAGEGTDWPEVIKNEECPHQVIPMTRKITPFADMRSLWQLYRFFKKERPDIIHSHTPKAGLLAMLAAKFAGVKIRIHTIAGLRFMTSTGVSRRILVAMEKLTASSATHVWPNSFSLLNYIKENKLARPEKLEVIGSGSSNGIDLERYSLKALDKDRLAQVKESIEYNDRLFYFLSVGRIVNDKGIGELLTAFTEVHKQHDNVRLILVGAFEDDLDPINATAREILLTHPAVIHTGWSDAVEYYMAVAQVLVHPSHREGFPNVLLQAGAMLCPIICSRIEGNIDIVEHQETGLLFEVKNEKELLSRMLYALSDPASMTEYATTLRSKIEAKFNQPVVHRQLLKRYREILS
jgi:glycosyltransferase involved in cell wall biosynthesis